MAEWIEPPPPPSVIVAPSTEPLHVVSSPKPATVEQPSSFPTTKVSTFGGMGLFLMQAFQVLADYGVAIVASVRELIIMGISGIAAWWVKERAK